MEQVISQFNVNKNFVQNIVHVFSVKHFYPCWQIRFVKISPLIVRCAINGKSAEGLGY